MTDYISREAALELIKELEYKESSWNVAGSMICAIRDMPAADVVEVVRCKDCIYMEKYELGTSAYCCLHSEGRLTLMLRYCPDGKRRNEA